MYTSCQNSDISTIRLRFSDPNFLKDSTVTDLANGDQMMFSNVSFLLYR